MGIDICTISNSSMAQIALGYIHVPLLNLLWSPSLDLLQNIFPYWFYLKFLFGFNFILLHFVFFHTILPSPLLSFIEFYGFLKVTCQWCTWIKLEVIMLATNHQIQSIFKYDFQTHGAMCLVFCNIYSWQTFSKQVSSKQIMNVVY